MELYDAVDELGGSSSSLESRVDALEAVDVSEDLRLDALEAVNSGARLTALEAVDVSELARLTALEAVNSGARLTALEGYPHSLHIAMGANVYTAQIATYVDLGGCYFDPASDPGSVIFRMVGDFVSTDAASSAKVYLYDMGPGDGTAFVPVRRAVLNIAFANVGKRMKVDQALTKTGAPGVDANQIYNTARVYQARMYLTSSDLAASMYVARVGFKVN